MVGVPGKSKGCITCRRRKVKCTEERPVCRKCASTNRNCEGYDRYPVFIVRTAQGIAKRKPLENARPNITATRARQDSRSSPGQTTRQITPSDSPMELDPVSEPQSFNVASVFLRAAESNFLEKWLPSTISRDHPKCAWMISVTSQTTRSAALEAALKALTLSRLGRSLDEPTLVQQGRTAYNLALVEVQKALWDKKQMFQDDTLAAGRVCSLYELYEATSGTSSSWGSHEMGMVRLVCLRGASRHQQGVAHEVFCAVRSSSMIYSIQKRESSMLLESDAWNTVPFVQKPKDDKQQLYDHGLVLGSILQDFSACNDPTLARTIRQLEAMKCLPELHRVGEGLKIWRQTCSVAISVEKDRCELIHQDQPRRDSSTSLVFLNFDEAELMITFWALQLLQTTGILMLGRLIPALFDQDRPANDVLRDLNLPVVDFPFLGERCMILGRNIMEAAQFLFRPVNGLLGPQAAIFPLRVLLSTYQRMKRPEVEACQQLYDQLTSKWGLGFAHSIRKEVDGNGT